MTRAEIEAEAKRLWKGKTWKEYLTIGIICIALLIVLNTGLVEVAVALLKIAFLIIGVFYLVRAAYVSYPLWKKKLDL